MADGDIVDALAACLEALRRNETDLQGCLGQYPEFAGELEALLSVVQRIRVLPTHIRPAGPYRARTRRLLARSNGNGAIDGEREWQPRGP